MTQEQYMAIALASIAGIIIASLIFYIITVIGEWKVFEKMGEPGWKAIIPVYNLYIQIKRIWNIKWFWIIVIAAAVEGLFSGLSGDEGGTFYYIYLLIAAFIGVITIMLNWKLCKAFHKGVGFLIGLIILEPIFMIILGFGSSQYIGNMSEKQ